MNTEPRLQYFPIPFFATVMGLSGFTIAWQRAESIFELPFKVSPYLLGIAGLVFILLFITYMMKVIRYPEAVKAELHHPIKLNFFPAISIGLILLGTGTLPISTDLSLYLWGFGAILHLIFTLYVMGMWTNKQYFKIEHINPAWFIPVVGNILVPIAGVSHGFIEASWFYFSFSLVFWIVLLAINFYRFIFHSPVPDKLLPTFFILIAPPAIGFLSYYNLTGHLDVFARILYYSALFFTLFLAVQLPRFTKLKFALSWWAYSFPVAAITISTLVMYHNIGGSWFLGLSLALVAILTLVIGILVTLTLKSVFRKEICVRED